MANKNNQAEKVNILPEGLLYDYNDSWVKSESRDGKAEIAKSEVSTVIVGLVGPSVQLAKEFVFINLPKKGSKIKKGEVYVSIEAVKWSGHVPSPVSGEVIEVNSPLFDCPSTINKDPYGDGWIMKMRLSKPEELKTLIDAKARAKLVKK